MQNQRIVIHSDKIWADSATQNTLKYSTTYSVALPNRPKYLGNLICCPLSVFQDIIGVESEASRLCIHYSRTIKFCAKIIRPFFILKRCNIINHPNKSIFYENWETHSFWVQGSSGSGNLNLFWNDLEGKTAFFDKNRNLGHSDADIEKWTLTTFACSGATFKFCNLGHFNEIPAFP